MDQYKQTLWPEVIFKIFTKHWVGIIFSVAELVDQQNFKTEELKPKLIFIKH